MNYVIAVLVLALVVTVVVGINYDWIFNINCKRRHNWTGVLWEDAAISKWDSPTVMYQFSQKRACRDCGWHSPQLNAGYVWTTPAETPKA